MAAPVMGFIKCDFRGLSSNPDRTLHAARMRVKAAAGHEKAPGYHPRGLVFILEILGCGADARYDPRRDAARSAEWVKDSTFGAGRESWKR